MLYFGKSLEFTKEILPDTPDSLILGFTNQQLLETWDAQDLVWAHVVDKELLYSPDPHLKENTLAKDPMYQKLAQNVLAE